MSAAVMSNYYFHADSGFLADSQMRVPQWMYAQMAQYPPPPQPDHPHYNALYPAAAGAQQLLDPQEQLQYSNLNQAIYPKVETAAADQASSNHQMQHLTQQLQQHAALGEHQQQFHHAQQVQQQQVHAQQAASAHSSQPPSLQGTPDQNPKNNRLRKACDSCSIRKVKCDESGPPCRACAALDIPCTFDRPTRRRGPPNRHAEAIKRRRLEETTGSPHPSRQSSPSSPTHAAQALAALSSHPSNQKLSAESICSVETLDLLIDDFFTYMHPLCPFPHEPSFREAWRRREDLTNPSFLALLSSMVGALVASFPRKPRLHLREHGKNDFFPDHTTLVERCQKVCSMARGSGYLESGALTLYDAATSYFLALTGLYTFQWRFARLYFGESLTIIRTLGLHKAREQTYTRLGSLPASVGSFGPNHEGDRNDKIDNITLEMSRRLFWTIFITIKSVQQLGAAFSELVIPPSTSSDPYPPLPTEVDDFGIYPQHNDTQHPGYLPLISGFNANVKIYTSYTSLTTVEMSWGVDTVVDWDRQQRVLRDSLKKCKDALNELPQELIFHPNNAHPLSSNDPASILVNPSDRMEDEQDPIQRRQLQCEIQKSNIYVSGLSTRQYLVEKYWNLRDAYDRMRPANSSSPGNSPGASVTGIGLDGLVPQSPPKKPDMLEQQVRQESENVVKEVLAVLGSIREVNVEPNADNFTMKIRTIAHMLLEMPDRRKDRLLQQVQEDLRLFLQTLNRLERTGPANNVDDEGIESRNWADLQAYQMKFTRLAGLL